MNRIPPNAWYRRLSCLKDAQEQLLFSDDKFEIPISSEDRAPTWCIILFVASIFLFWLAAAGVSMMITPQTGLADALSHLNYVSLGLGFFVFLLVEYIFLAEYSRRKGRKRLEITEHDIKIYSGFSKVPENIIRLEQIQTFKKNDNDWRGITAALIYWPNNGACTSFNIMYSGEHGGNYRVSFKGLSHRYVSWLTLLMNQLKYEKDTVKPIEETQEYIPSANAFPKSDFVENCKQYVPSLVYAPFGKWIEKKDCIAFRMKAKKVHARLCTFGGAFIFFISGIIFNSIENILVHPIYFAFGLVFGLVGMRMISNGINNRSKQYDFVLYHDHLEVTPTWLFLFRGRTKRLNYGASLVTDLENGERMMSENAEICVNRLEDIDKIWLYQLVSDLHTPNKKRDLTRYDSAHSMDDLYHSLDEFSTGWFKTENREDGFTAVAPYGSTFSSAPILGMLIFAAGIYFPAWGLTVLIDDLASLIFTKAMLTAAWTLEVAVLADGILFCYNNARMRRNKNVALSVTAEACLLYNYNQKALIGLNPTFDGVPAFFDDELEVSSNLGKYRFKIPDEMSRALICRLLTNIRYPAWATEEQKADLAVTKAKKNKDAIERKILKHNMMYGPGYEAQTNLNSAQQIQTPRTIFMQRINEFGNKPYPVAEKPEIHPVLSQPMILKNTSAIAPHYKALDGKYHDLVPIGTGAQGTMFRAFDNNRQPVGIKVYDFMRATDWKSSELFEREVQTLRHLHFQGIPKFIELIDANPQYFLVESFIAAPSMASRMRNGHRPSMVQAILTLRHIAEILNYLQTRQPAVIHRDIKPENLLVDDRANVWLVDFGVVAAEVQKTNAMTFAGTAGYMAPEQLMGKVTPAVDIYAAGVTMIAYISGKSPLDMEMCDLAIAVEKILPPTTPEWVLLLLTHMTTPDPQKRIQTGAQILHIMDSYMNPSRHGAQPPQSYQSYQSRPQQPPQSYSTYAQ